MTVSAATTVAPVRTVGAGTMVLAMCVDDGSTLFASSRLKIECAREMLNKVFTH